MDSNCHEGRLLDRQHGRNRANPGFRAYLTPHFTTYTLSVSQTHSSWFIQTLTFLSHWVDTASRHRLGAVVILSSFGNSFHFQLDDNSSTSFGQTWPILCRKASRLLRHCIICPRVNNAMLRSWLTERCYGGFGFQTRWRHGLWRRRFSRSYHLEVCRKAASRGRGSSEGVWR